jgi:hypothetical protein
MLDKNFIDLDPVFNMNIDEDYDFRASGITRNSFCNVYMDWIQYCAAKRTKVNEPIDITLHHCIVNLTVIVHEKFLFHTDMKV